MGGAGGVGSIAVQLAGALTDLTSSPRPREQRPSLGLKAMGAHHVIAHRQPLAAQVSALALGAPAFVFSTVQRNLQAREIAELIVTQGRFGVIDELAGGGTLREQVRVDSLGIRVHALALPDGRHDRTGRLLNEVSRLADEGILRSTITERFSPINAANLKHVHALVESGQARGKVVLEGFNPTTRHLFFKLFDSPMYLRRQFPHR